MDVMVTVPKGYDMTAKMYADLCFWRVCGTPRRTTKGDKIYFIHDGEVALEATTANWRERRAGLVDLLSDWDNSMTRHMTLLCIHTKRRMEEKAAEDKPPDGQDRKD